MAYVLKIGVIGSEACGKTRFCNYLGSINGTSEYTPTVGVRIVELSEQVTVVNPKKEKQKIYDVPITVQLWDCSSNSKYSHLWSAWAHDLHGLIMFKPKEISTLRDQFKVFKKPLKRGSCFLTIADHPSRSGNVLLFSTRNKFFLENLSKIALFSIVGMKKSSEILKHALSSGLERLLVYTRKLTLTSLNHRRINSKFISLWCDRIDFL